MASHREDPETHAVIGAAMAVHSVLGYGFLESVYSRAMARELELRGIPHRSEVPLPVYYRGAPLEITFRADLLCFQRLIVELKAQPATGKPELSQVINYLKAAQLDRALLLNFGAPRLQYTRLVR